MRIKGSGILIFLSLLIAEEALKAAMMDDLNYYRKISEKQNLTKNDRLFILNKILKKYEGKVDTKPIIDEMKKLEGGKTIKEFSYKKLQDRWVYEFKVEGQPRSKFSIIEGPEGEAIGYVIEVDAKSSLKEDIIELKEGAIATISILDIGSNTMIKLFKRDEYKDFHAKAEKQKNKVVITLAKEEKEEKPATGVVEISDMLKITVSPAGELSRDVIVAPDGSITMPLIGKVFVQGKTSTLAAKELETLYSKYITNPKVTVDIIKSLAKNVFISGEVTLGGIYEYFPGITLTQLVSAARGFTPKADKESIEVYRRLENRFEKINVNYTKVPDFKLMPGDSVIVKAALVEVSIIGEVKYPGRYAYIKGMKLLDLISQAGGYIPDTANLKKISILRKGSSKIIKVNAKKIMEGKHEDIELIEGDIVSIPRSSFASTTSYMTTQILPWISLFALLLAIGVRI